jgi:hypothetical protein
MILHLQRARRNGGSAAETYSRGAISEFRPGHQLCWLMFFGGFSQSLQASTGIIPGLGNNHSLPILCQSIIKQPFYHSVLYSLDGVRAVKESMFVLSDYARHLVFMTLQFGLANMASLCWKCYHQKDRDITWVSILMEKWRNKIQIWKGQSKEKKIKTTKNEDTKDTTLRWISTGLFFWC